MLGGAKTATIVRLSHTHTDTDPAAPEPHPFPYASLLYGQLMLVALPVLALHVYGDGGRDISELLVSYGLAYLAFVAFCAVSSRLPGPARWIIAGLFATHYVIKAVAVGFEVISGEPFDPLFLRDNYQELVRAGRLFIGRQGLLTAAVLLPVLWADYFFLFKRFAFSLARIRTRTAHGLAVAGVATLVLVPSARGEVLTGALYAEDLLFPRSTRSSWRTRRTSRPTAPRTCSSSSWSPATR